jgi:8-hydroxy-5-deazaflavin:NADPH oxidoreductase
MEKRNIGILGSGTVGQTLATGFINHGFEVTIGTNNPHKLEEWQSQNPNGKVADFKHAASFGDIIILAVKGKFAIKVLEQAEVGTLIGKTVVDATNPIDDQRAPTKGVLHFYTGSNESQLEMLQEKFAEAHFVKAFNSVGSFLMVNPDFGGIKPTMFICGENDRAKQETIEILEMFGWEPADMGGKEAARSIESLCILWCIPGIRDNQWGHAFKLLKK